MFFALDDFWWEENDFHFIKDGKEHILRNAYWSDIGFVGLDVSDKEDVTIVGNNKVWETGVP